MQARVRVRVQPWALQLWVQVQELVRAQVQAQLWALRQWHHHNQPQPLQVSKRHYASIRCSCFSKLRLKRSTSC